MVAGILVRLVHRIYVLYIYYTKENIVMSLVVENIIVSFANRQVLKGVTIRSDKGKVTGLLGRNGCGKSTLLKVVFGTVTAVDAIIHLNGHKIVQPYKWKGVINFLPQFSFFPRDLKVQGALRKFKVSDNLILADLPELEIDLSKTFGELSGGSERLISALILLLAPTQFTLLDEPFTHLMPVHLEKLKKVITRQKQNKGIIITDHLYQHVSGISDQQYLIKDGKSFVINGEDSLMFHGYIHDPSKGV